MFVVIFEQSEKTTFLSDSERLLFAIYQLDFFTPGISPLEANSRKHIRHREKSRINPLFLPQRQQRRTIRVEYLGLFLALAITDFFAIKENLIIDIILLPGLSFLHW